MNAATPSTRQIGLTASDGTDLEAEVSWPARDVSAVAVLSHPHPLYGGDMWNPLIDHLFRALPAIGIAALRYNFRGVGSSGGEHDNGVAEQLDTAAAFAEAAALASEGDADGVAPVISAGWSFGGDVSLGTDHDKLAAWVGIAAPIRIVDESAMAAPMDARPKLLLVPEHDQFRSPAEAFEIFSSWTNAQMRTIASGDHFLTGHARAVAEMIGEFVADL